MKNKLKVFLVGSDLNSLRIYKQQMKSTPGEHFSFCLNGTISLHHLEEMPKVIFLNCSRNELFGLPVLRRIRKSHPSTNIVIVVSPDNIKIARHALNCGAFAYIVKGDNELQQITNVMQLIGTLNKEHPLPVKTLSEQLRSLLLFPYKFFLLRKLVPGHR